MKITLDLAESILEQFQNSYPCDLINGLVHGIDVVLDEGEPAIRLCLTDNEKLSFNEQVASLSFPKTFVYENKSDKTTFTLPVIFEIVEIPQAQFAPGDPVSPSGVNYYGTGGWNFYLNDLPMLLSNWHVLCDLGNNTPLGRRIILNNQDIASLHGFLNVTPGRPNSWDYAYARFDSEAAMSAYMRPCRTECPPGRDNCTIPIEPVPKQIVNDIPQGLRCKKVGAREPVCRFGDVQGFGNRTVDYGSRGGRIEFRNQVILSKMSDPGDSGALIFTIKSGTPYAVALNFAGSDQETIANPLIRAPLTYLGTRTIPGTNKVVPAFRG